MVKRLGSRASEMRMKLRAGRHSLSRYPVWIDAAIHCTESSIFVFGVGQTTEASRLGYLWELTLENGEPTTRSEHSYPVAQSANSPSLRVDRDHIDTLYWDPEDANDMKLVGKRFQRSTFTEQSEVEFVTTI